MKKQKVGGQLVHDNKSNNREYNYNVDDDDGMDMLPEEILRSIVYLLPLKDAAATSALSRRWRYLWTNNKNLNFDVALDLSNFSKRKLKFKRRRFINWVNTVINQHADDDAIIDHFRVSFDLHASHGHCISNWIQFALQNRVQVLELEFLVGGQCVRVNRSRFGNEYNYNLDQQVLASKGVEVGFKSLKVLNLLGVDVDGKVIEYLLSNCQLLERLQVTGSSKLTNLRVVGRRASLALKHLEIKLCSKIQRVRICNAENLVSFYCDRCKLQQPIRLVIRNVPMLVDLKIVLDGAYSVLAICTALSSCLSQLQILELDLCFQEYVENPVYPMLTNLKELRLALDPHDGHILAQLIPFMEASPFLQKLVLKITEWKDDEEKQEFIKPANCSHHFLKELQVFGYGGRPNEDELIVYFIENAVSLQKIIVNPCLFIEFPHVKVPKHKKDMMEEEEIARGHAMQHLKQKVPSTIEFICF